jgi:hypothetical protein
MPGSKLIASGYQGDRRFIRRNVPRKLGFRLRGLELTVTATSGHGLPVSLDILPLKPTFNSIIKKYCILIFFYFLFLFQLTASFLTGKTSKMQL